jgi:hypothetical protein
MAGIATVSSQRSTPSLLSGAEPVEHHRPHERPDVDLPPARAQGPAKGTVETKVLPDLMQRKDVAVGRCCTSNA